MGLHGVEESFMKVVQHTKLHCVGIWLSKLGYSAGNVSGGIEVLMYMDVRKRIKCSPSLKIRYCYGHEVPRLV